MEFKVYLHLWGQAAPACSNSASFDGNDREISESYSDSASLSFDKFDKVITPIKLIVPSSPSLVVSPHSFNIDSEDKLGSVSTDSTERLSIAEVNVSKFRGNSSESQNGRTIHAKKLNYEKLKSFHAFKSRSVVVDHFEDEHEAGSAEKANGFGQLISIDALTECAHTQLDGLLAIESFGTQLSVEVGALNSSFEMHKAELDECYMCFGEQNSGKSHILFGDLSNASNATISGIIPHIISSLLANTSVAKVSISAVAYDGAVSRSVEVAEGLFVTDITAISELSAISSTINRNLDIEHSHLTVTVNALTKHFVKKFHFVELRPSIIHVPRSMLPLIPSRCASVSLSSNTDNTKQRISTALDGDIDPDVQRANASSQLGEMYHRVASMISAWLGTATAEVATTETHNENALQTMLIDCFHGKLKTTVVANIDKNSCIQNHLEESSGDSSRIKPTIELALALKETAEIISLCELLLSKSEEIDPVIWSAELVPKTFTPSYMMMGHAANGGAVAAFSSKDFQGDIRGEIAAAAVGDDHSCSAQVEVTDPELLAVQAFKTLINNKLTEIFRSEEYFNRCVNAEKACSELERDKEALLIKLRTTENELKLISEVWRSPSQSFSTGTKMSSHNNSFSLLSPLNSAHLSGDNVVQIDNLEGILDPTVFTESLKKQQASITTPFAVSTGSGLAMATPKTDVKATAANAREDHEASLMGMALSRDVVEDNDDDDELFPMPSVSYFSPNLFESTDQSDALPPPEPHAMAAAADGAGAAGSGVGTGASAPRMPLVRGSSTSSTASRSSRSDNWAAAANTAALDHSVADHIRLMKQQYKEINTLIDSKLKQIKLSEEQERDIEQARQRLEEERMEKLKAEQNYLDMLKQFETLKNENAKLQQFQMESEARIKLLEAKSAEATEAAEQAKNALAAKLAALEDPKKTTNNSIAVVLPGGQTLQSWEEIFATSEASAAADVKFVYRSDDEDDDRQVSGRSSARSGHRITRSPSESTDDNGLDFRNDDEEDSENDFEFGGSDNGSEFVRASPSVLLMMSPKNRGNLEQNEQEKQQQRTPVAHARQQDRPGQLPIMSTPRVTNPSIVSNHPTSSIANPSHPLNKANHVNPKPASSSTPAPAPAPAPVEEESIGSMLFSWIPIPTIPGITPTK